MIDRTIAGRVSLTWRLALGLLLAIMIAAANPLMTVAQPAGGWSVSAQTDKTDPDDGEDAEDEEQEEQSPGTDADFEALGLTSETSYESPQFGFAVEWDDPWFIELEEYPEGSLMSDPTTEPPFDMVRVESTVTSEAVYVYGYLLEGSWLEDADDIPAAHVDGYYAYEDGEGLEDTGIESIEVLFDDADDEFGAVLYLITWETGEQYISLSEMWLVDDFFIITSLSAHPMNFMETFTAAREGIEIDGEPAVGFLDGDDVAETVEAAIEEYELDSPSGGGTGDDPEESPSPESEDDLTYYLQGVRGAADALNDSMDRFFELLTSEEELTDEDVDELNGILDLWESAPNLAIAGNPPAGVDDIHDILLDYLDTLAEASAVFVEYARADDEAEQDELGETFDQLIEDAYDLYDDLTAALDAAE